MDIFLSVNNREQILQLPVVPPEFTITKPHKNDTFETASQGDLKLLGVAGLKGITIDSFFPVRDYPFLRSTAYKGFEYVYIIDTWIAAKLPIRLIITDTPINMAVAVDNFEYTIRQDGNLNYSLACSEFPLINTM
jgi:hypothetical protein